MTPSDPTANDPSKTDESGLPLIALVIFTIAPLTVGIGMLTVRHLSLRRFESMKSWVATPCVVERLGVADGGEDGSSPAIEYRYEVDGTEYRGNDLDPVVGRMGDDDEFEERIRLEYAPGSAATCYVDPADSSNSVFDREHGRDAPRRMMLLAFPFTFVGLIFGAGLVGGVFGARRKTGAEPAPAPTVEPPLDPPPRRIPLLTRLAVLAGPGGSQLAWLFFMGFAFVFILLDGPASYARLFNWGSEEATVIGRVTDVRGMEQHELYATVYQFTVAYEVDGQSYESKSYLRGEQYDEGEEVTVTYDPESPGAGTIEGARASSFTWWHSAIPLGVLLLLALGLAGMYVHNFRALRVLRHGRLTRAEWKAPTPTDAPVVDGQPEAPSVLSNYIFEVGGRSYRARQYGGSTKRKRDSSGAVTDDGGTVPVLYLPQRPERNIVVDGALADMLAGRRTVGERLLDCAAAPFAIGALVVLINATGFS